MWLMPLLFFILKILHSMFSGGTFALLFYKCLQLCRYLCPGHKLAPVSGVFSCLMTMKAGHIIHLKGSSQVFVKSADIHRHQDLSKFLVDLLAMSPDIRKNLAGEWVYVRQKTIAHNIFQCPAPTPKNRHWDDSCPITPCKLPHFLLADSPLNLWPISSPVPLQPLLLLESMHTPKSATGMRWWCSAGSWSWCISPASAPLVAWNDIYTPIDYGCTDAGLCIHSMANNPVCDAAHRWAKRIG